MNSSALQDILKLTIEERIRLVEDIWDSITEIPESIILTDSQKHELDLRLDEFYKNPSDGSKWDIIKKKILK